MIYDDAFFDALAAKLAPRLLAGLQGRAAAPAVVGDEPFSVDGFAAAVGRSKVWVYRMISARRIAVLPTGKPYQIPRTEAAKWKKAKGTVV